ncbi:MAG: PDZ domain-containing protein [Verrucomicrobiaceae bacterium]|nr:MAG: PDZ domain-containing protein [Verrucomicrobiaceae bacterium]
MNASHLPIIFSLALMLPVSAQQSLETAYRTTGSQVVAAFEPQRQFLQRSSAVIADGRKEIAYGVVVSPEGHILTKASEVIGVSQISVTVDQQKFTGAKLVIVDPAWDVALLKVEATGLTPVTYAPTSAVPQGTWVVANGATTRTARRLLAGIVSAKIREIPAAGGAALGVILGKSKPVEITEVDDKSGAKEAGLLKGDVILTIEGSKIGSVEDIGKVLKDRKAGSTVKVKYRRDGKEATVEVRLAAREELFDHQMNRNDQMSGEFSLRRSGFPRVMQHDILGSRKLQGGPLLDLDGRCIGMNIARANRAESFAIPVEDLKEIAGRLMAQQVPH